MSTASYWGRRALTVLVLPLVCAIGILVLQPTDAAFAQTNGQVSGTVYYDVPGNANPSDFTLFPVPAEVSIYRGSTFIASTTTDASGRYTFTNLTPSTTAYYIAVTNPDELSGVSDGQGPILVDQTYGSGGTSPKHGPICAGTKALYQPQLSGLTGGAQNGQRSGPCYGGRAVTIEPNAIELLNYRYITMVEVGDGANITGVDFAFSHNVVTHVKYNEAGSLRNFIRAANVISDVNTMRFVPVEAPNVDLGAGKKWWRVNLTSTTSLPAITGDEVTLDGQAYNYKTNAVENTNTGDIFGATAVGVTNHSIPALARPELEIMEQLGNNEATVEVQANNVTIRNLALNNSITSAAYQIRQSEGTALTVENVAVGYDMTTNAAATARTLYGIQTAYTTPTTGSGTIHHNYVASNSTSILLSNSTSDPGNVVAATLGDWTVSENVINGGIRLGAGTDRILIQHNKSDEAIVMALSLGINQAIGHNTITENTITSSSGDIIRIYGADNNTMTLNKLQNSAGSGVSIMNGGNGNYVSQNAFQGNQGNAIDLGDNGVTEATSCTGAGSANNGLGRPTIASASFVGDQLTVSGSYCETGTFHIELYKANAGAGDTGAGAVEAGEGMTYLGTLSNLSGGSFASQSITVPVTAGLNIGDKITALLLKPQSGDSSEFSANYKLSLSISGKVFHDVDGTAADDGPAFAGSTTADVNLYDTNGSFIARTFLDANGNFVFTDLTNGTYHLTVNEYRGLATGTVGDGSLQVEQTYAAAGTNAAAGSGPICLGTAPTYAAQTSGSPTLWTVGAQNGNALAGPCYGGRSSNAGSPQDTVTPTPGSSEHAIRIVLQDYSVTAVKFGFSANVVTNLGTGLTQGTLASYLTLANTLSGANTMRFVPVQPTNKSSGSDKWWQLAVPSALPQITAADTSLSGIAYSNADGTTILNTNKITIGATSKVGLGADGRANTGDEATLSSMSGPELELIPSATIAYGLDINANNVAVRDLAIYGFGSATLPSGATNQGETGNIVLRSGVSNVNLTGNVLGASAVSFSNPGANGTKGSNIIFEGSASSVTISDNLIGFAGDSGLLKLAKSGKGPLTNVTVTRNEIRNNGLAPAANTQGAGIELNNISLPGSAQTVLIKHNLISANAAQGIQLDFNRGATIEENTVSGNGIGASVAFDERKNIQLSSGESITIRHNDITGSAVSDGIALRTGVGAGAAPATKVRISENRFDNNRGKAINLGSAVANGNCAESSQQNMGVDVPVISLAEISGTTLKLNGTSCAGVSGTIEVYKISANNTVDETAGEGETFLGSFAVTGGAFSNKQLTGINNVIAGEYVTVLFIGGNGNTSEFSQNAYVYTPVALTVTPSVVEGQGGTITASINVTSLKAISLTIKATNETTADNDYTVGKHITIPAGQLQAAIPYNTTDDTTVEETESFTVHIIDADYATFTAATQRISIVDNDQTSVTLAATATLVEGESGLVTATLATLSVNPVQITLVYTDIDTTGSDYSATLNLTVPGGQQSASVPFTANVDNEVENTETLQVSIGSVSGANSVATPQTITILNDTDHDTYPDVRDMDDDGDGISDELEGDGGRNTDGDSWPDSLDTDSDNDNIPDAIEGHDANGDGIPDRAFANADANGNGLDDAFDPDAGGQVPTLPDADSDNTPNYLDDNDDNDDTLTKDEDANSDGDNNPATNPTDADGDQIPDYFDPADDPNTPNGGDSDNDGIMDIFEYDADGNGSGPDNTDGDSQPDYMDNDDDNDSILTQDEQADPNGDGDPSDAVDTEADGTPNYRDNDDDNDGKLTGSEGAATDNDGDGIMDYLDPDDETTGANGGDSDNDGVADAFEHDANGDNATPDNTDGDALVNYLDNDDDGDGLPTAQEYADLDNNGNPSDALDSDTDGTPNYLDDDSDNDGLFDGAEFALGDSDSDGKEDYRDDDDDNDGVLTRNEHPDANGDKLPTDARDSDGDGKPDYLDKDDDNDGKETVAEGATTDADKDGILDYLDPVDAPGNANGGDSDGDGVSDKFEFDVTGDGQGPDDSDGDTKPNYWDTDDDNDGIPTTQEQADPNGDGNPADAVDTDGDSLANFRDSDDDGDGKSTATEGAATDADKDGILDYLDPVDAASNANGGDSDGDGISDKFEFDVDGNGQGPDDSDGDGKPNYLDTDDDNDGAATGTENADPNGDGNPADAKDTDGDTTVDYLDSNNLDGLNADNDGDGVTTGNEDVNQDGNIHNDDTDGDGTPNYLDTDDDGDTVATKDETAKGDTDSDGKPDYLDTDDDGDSVLTKDEVGKGDTDSDGKPNYLDNDDDNDGILTKDEDANGDGNPTNDDADKDGTPNYLDTDSTLDSDGDGTPDNVDTDDDNDGVSDSDEGNGSLDTDNDGKPDVFDTDDDGDGVLTKDENSEAANLPGVRSANGAAAYPDTDNDGTPNYIDTDDDGDGILTKDELPNKDSDGDGIRDYLDMDDDNDGIPTKMDNTGLDPADTNLLDDDTDGDGIPNYLDNDDDGDGVPTIREDIDGDGNPSNDDSDGDGIINMLDTDDNGNGIPTKDEDANGDGDPTNDDSDGNGIPDYADTGKPVAKTFRILLPVVTR